MKLFKKQEIKYVNAPTINELKLSDIWSKFKNNIKIRPYFPDYSNDKKPNWRYLLNVILF